MRSGAHSITCSERFKTRFGYFWGVANYANRLQINCALQKYVYNFDIHSILKKEK